MALKLTPHQSFDLRDVMLEAQAEVQAVMREILQDLALPQMLDAFKMQWAQMPPAMKEKFKAERPEQYKALVEMMK
jgi:hypothetical protein